MIYEDENLQLQRNEKIYAFLELTKDQGYGLKGGPVVKLKIYQTYTAFLAENRFIYSDIFFFFVGFAKDKER